MKLHNLTGHAGGVHVDPPSVILNVTSGQPADTGFNPLVLIAALFFLMMCCILASAMFFGGG